MRIRLAAFGAAALLFTPAFASAQSITTEPLMAVPIGNPWVLFIFGVMLTGGLWWMLRHHPLTRGGAGLAAAMVSTAIGLVLVMDAQATLTFTDPAGQTLSIPITPETTGDDVDGWEPADFTNSSGVDLVIAAIDAPDSEECFPDGLDGELMPGSSDASPHPACEVNETLADGATCRVDVETICRAAAAGELATLASIAPVSGSSVGGTVVTLTGTNLDSATGVTFDGVAATNVTVVDDTTVTAQTPAHATGAVDVTIRTAVGSATLANGFTYVGPTLTSVAPASGSNTGGTGVTLTGTNLTGATAVTFDGSPATSVTVINDTTVSADTPTHANGVVDITITTPGGSATLAGGYTYTGPTLTSVTASSGSASGGAGITLTGTGLTGTTGITFDGVAATSVNVVNSTTVTAVTPAHAAGAADIVVATPDGTATLANGFTYATTAVGQSAFGGIIAALNGGLNNLIATIAESGPHFWGGAGTAVGAGAQSNTDGASNTAAIVAALGNNGGTPYGAQICSDHEVDSQGNTPCQPGNACYNDWFLPAGNNSTASGQLNALYINRVAIGGFVNASYLSSTEDSGAPAIRAWNLSFSTGVQSNGFKNLGGRLRCVRAFTP